MSQETPRIYPGVVHDIENATFQDSTPENISYSSNNESVNPDTFLDKVKMFLFISFYPPICFFTIGPILIIIWCIVSFIVFEYESSTDPAVKIAKEMAERRRETKREMEE